MAPQHPAAHHALREGSAPSKAEQGDTVAAGGTWHWLKSQLSNTVSAEQPVSVNTLHMEKAESVIQKWENSSEKQESVEWNQGPLQQQQHQRCLRIVIIQFFCCYMIYTCVHKATWGFAFSGLQTPHAFAHNCRVHYCLHSRYSSVLQVELLWASDQSSCDSKRRVNLLTWHLPWPACSVTLPSGVWHSHCSCLNTAGCCFYFLCK